MGPEKLNHKFARDYQLCLQPSVSLKLTATANTMKPPKIDNAPPDYRLDRNIEVNIGHYLDPNASNLATTARQAVES